MRKIESPLNGLQAFSRTTRYAAGADPQFDRAVVELQRRLVN
jgi:hypothetical protein